MSTLEPSSRLQVISEEHLDYLIDIIRDWQFEHGSLLKFPPDSGKIIARPIGVSVFPSDYPKKCFEEARNLQIAFNLLYAAVACDGPWLHEALRKLIDSNSMANIYGRFIVLSWRKDTYLAETGAYGADGSDIVFRLPPNNTIQSIAEGLAEAHAVYGAAKSGQTSATAILFVVQPNNVNVCDERPIEYILRRMGVPSYRVEFRQHTLASTWLTSSRELLFYPISSASSASAEISVVYHRAGYDLEEYNEAGCEARYQLEMSRAIKCPSILCHLATLKIVQQKLAMPGSLERFLSTEDTARVARTFAPMYPLDDSELGRKARALAMDVESATKHVLKPSLEGGGHNIYRDAIPAFLKSQSESSWHEYVLVEMIEPPIVQNILLSRGIYSGPVISELGIFGICLWRHSSAGLEVIQNRQTGFSFKTKARDSDEMSVVKALDVSTVPI
ncbi:MAG: hypothetical protein Q9217_000437 [Psora testacea]